MPEDHLRDLNGPPSSAKKKKVTPEELKEFVRECNVRRSSCYLPVDVSSVASTADRGMLRGLGITW